MQYFIPANVNIYLKNGDTITDIQSDDRTFLDIDITNFKNSLITDWIFEPYKSKVLHFLQSKQSNGKNHQEPQISAWFTNKKNKYFWCNITIPLQEHFPPNQIIIQDYTPVLPSSLNIFEQNPLIFNFLYELDLPIGITDIAGNWIHANPALCSLFGYSREELLQMRWQDVTDPKNVERETTVFEEALKNPQFLLKGVTLVEKYYIKKDGSPFHALVHTIAIPGDQCIPIRCFFSYIENLDEKERLQKEAERNRQFLRTILDLIPVRVFWKSTDSHYLGCNTAFARDVGKDSPEEIIGKTDYDFKWGVHAELYRKDDREVIQTGISKLFYEEPQITPDGRLIYLRTSKVPLLGPGGEPIGVLGIYEDITEFKKIINTLNETMSLLKAIINSAPIGIIAINSEGNIELWNKATQNILGWYIDEVISKPSTYFVPQITKIISENQKISTSSDNGNSYDIEITEYNKTGELLSLRIVYRIIQTTSQGLLKLILIQDITNLKKIQIEQEQLRTQLQHTQKLESLGILSSSIAHDFNNILMAIMGNIDLALSELQNANAIKSYLINIDESVKNAAELCKELLVFSGKKQQSHQILDINNIIKEMQHLLRVSVSKKILLEFDLAPETLSLSGEPGQLRSIILNLVINASDAIDNHSGIIRIKTSTVDIDTSYLRTTWFKEGIELKRYIALEVSDTGCGMDSETISKIFDPFFTTKEKGRGLGLATVMGAIRAHSGTIKVYSELGKGTTFKLLFPYVKSTHTQTEIETPKEWQGKGTILLADDETVVLQVTTKMLEKLGFSVIPAKDGREAIKLFEMYKDTISAVLLDITMPHQDGMEVARFIRSKLPHLPIFLSSGFYKNSLEEKELDFPIQGFLHKPYNIDSLSKALQKHIQS